MLRLLLGVVAGLCIGSLEAGAATEAATGAAIKKAAEAPPECSHTGSESNRKFDINEYVVDGNSVLSVPDIEEAVYPFLGEARTVSDIYRACGALEKIYETRGYQTVQVLIPQQSIDGGIIHLQVAENPVGRLRVVNSQYHLPSEIKANAPSVAEGKVLKMADLQSDIVALNQSPDLQVTPDLKAGKVPGTVDIDLKVTKETLPLHGSLTLDNQYNQDTTPLRLVASASYDNLWQLGHSLSLSYQIAPENPSDAKVLSANYLARIPQNPLSLLVYAVKSDSDVAAVAGTDVIGRGDIEGFRANITFPGSDGFSHYVSAGVDRKDLTQDVVTGGVPSNAPVTYYPMTVAYFATVQDHDTTTDANASLNFATPGLGSQSAEFDPQRFKAIPQYFYVKLSADRTQPLPWGMSLYGKVEGQLTDDALLTSEQFSIGGANSVRGYLEAERLGDIGERTTLELRSPSIASSLSPRVNDLHFLAFADTAVAALQEPLPGETPSFFLAGVGAGVRLTAFDDFNAALDFAFPLENGAVTKAGDMHVHFLVSSVF